MFFLSLDQVPESFNYLPEIDYKCPWKWEDRGLKRDDKYIVITPCFTHNSRKMRSRYILELSEYISRLGYKPVLLGKLDFTIDAYKSYIDEGRLLSNNSVNLINMTSLLESIHIMSRAKIVMGIDNGLLHFAGCTNTPIIFGHTITIPRHRTIRRRKGKVIDLTLSQKTLECIGCQSNMRFMLEKTIEGYKGHSFKNCIYNDYACLDLIFKDNCETWKKAIDHILAGY
jgi:ADP-heptose:LPS heptosyltransferase